MWDRTKQKYWVCRADWSIRDTDGKFVMKCPKYIDVYDTKLLEKICFADSQKTLEDILSEEQRTGN